MIEDDIRATLARHELLTPDGAALRPRIAAEARRRRRRTRIGQVLAGILVLAVLVAVPVAWRGTRSVVPPAEPRVAVARTFLLIGTDRPAGSPDPARADAVMLAHVSADGRHATLVSVPRDTLVPFAGHREKINQVYALGGAPALAGALADLVGVRFDGTVTMDFAGLRSVTDAVGGVDLCVERRFTSMHTSRVFEPGCRHFTGDEALDYVRQRYDLPGGDLDRVRHEQDLLRALAGRLAALDTSDLVGVVRAAGPAVGLDLGVLELVRLAGELRGLRADDVAAVTVPTRTSASGATYLGEEPGEGAADLFRAIRDDTLPDWIAAHPAD
ncbi:LCP family protein [Longispora sp. K20-0274]|uniref:LCP family protein n=1 Tax=Longispora sp. K20-0274 TaxID=3088255 RepID=UPI003999F2D2